jgi:glutamate mutase epsilon subunit
VSTILIAADESIIIGGTFTGVSGMTRNRIARIFSNGTLDTTFDPNANNAVGVLTMNTHSVYIGGAFTAVG